MANRRSIRVKWMGFVILAALSLVGCSEQTASLSKPAPKPVIHGASSPTAAVKGFLGAVRDGNTKQALAYWEFPEKGTEAYKVAKPPIGQSYQARVFAQVRKQRLDWTKRRINYSKWNFDVLLYVRPPDSGGYTRSLKVANWALVLVSYTLPNQHTVAAQYVVHKSAGRWKLLTWAQTYGARN